MLDKLVRNAVKQNRKAPESLDEAVNNILADKNQEIQQGTTPEFIPSQGAGGGAINVQNSDEVFRLLGSDFATDQNKDLDYNTRLSINQTGAEALKRSLSGFKDQAMLGFIDSVGAWDIEDLYNVSIGNTEAEYGNWLTNSNFAKELKEKTGNEIYSVGDDFGTVEYWAKLGQSLGYTGGIIAEMAAEQVALAYTTGGSGNLASVGGVASKLNLAKQALFGSFKGVQEAYMNSNETRSSTYQEYISRGYDEEIAQKKANEAAALSYRAEIAPLMALNALQFGMTFGKIGKTKAFSKGNNKLGVGFSDAFEELGEVVVGNKVKNKFLKKAIGGTLQASSEAVEEGVQNLASDYGKRETLRTTLDHNLNSDYINQDLGTSMLTGFIGGGFFNGAFKGVETLSNRKAVKQRNKQHKDFVTDATKRSANTFKAAEKVKQYYEDAAKQYENNPNPSTLSNLEKATIAVKQADYNAHLVNTANALELDYLKQDGDTVAFNSHVAQMQTLLDATNNLSSQDKDTQANALNILKQYGILDDKGLENYKGSLETIKNTFEQNIKDSQNIKKYLEDTLVNTTQDFSSALAIVQPKYNNDKHLQEINKIEQSLNNKYNKELSFQKLSSEGKQRFETELKIKSLEYQPSLSLEQKEIKKELEQSLKDLPEYSALDKQNISRIEELPYLSNYTSIESLNSAINNNLKKISNLSKKSTIISSIKERTKNKIKRAETKEEVEEVLNNSPEVSEEPEIKQEVEKKEKEIKVKKASKEFTKKPVEASIEVKEKIKRATPTQTSLFSLGNMDFTSGGDLGSSRNYNEALKEAQPMLEEVLTELELELGKKPSFEEFLINTIEKFGKKETQKITDFYAQVWKNSGRDTGNLNSIKNRLFNKAGSLFNLAMQAVEEQVVVDNETREVENINQAIEVNIETSPVNSFDFNNIPQEKDGEYLEIESRTNRPGPKASHLGTIEGELVISEQYNSDNIKDPDFIKEGTILSIEPIENVNSLKVADWIVQNNELVKKEITFGDWLKKYDVEEGSDRWINKVPLFAKIGEQDGFFLHDTDWYNTNNVATIESIKEGKKQLQAIRNSILNGNRKIVITKVGSGKLVKTNLLSGVNKRPLVLSEATGENILAVAKTKNELIDSSYKTTSETINNKYKLTNSSDYIPGLLYELRHVHTEKDGTKLYTAFNVLTNDLSKGEKVNDIAFNNSKFSTLSSIILNNSTNSQLLKTLESKYGITFSKAQQIQKDIQFSTGLNIKSELGEYLKLFTKVIDSNEAFKQIVESSQVNPQGKQIFPKGATYTNIVKSNGNQTIRFHVKQGGILPTTEKGYLSVPGFQLFNINKSNTSTVLNILSETFETSKTFYNTSFNVNKDLLNKNRPLIIINERGETSEYNSNPNGENTYEGFIKDSVKTNIKSFKITSPITGKDKWITTPQRMVYFDVVKEESLPIKEETIKEEIVEKTKNKPEIKNTPSNVFEAIEDITDTNLKSDVLDILEHLDLGDEFNSRREMNEQIEEGLSFYNSNSIPNVTSAQQYEVVNSLFNLVLSNTNIKENYINISDLSKEIEQSLDTYLSPEILKLELTLEKLKQLDKPGLDILVNKIENKKIQLSSFIENKEKIVGNTKEKKGDLVLKIQQFLATVIDPVEQALEEDTGETEHDFTASSLEKNVKLSFSTGLKIFFTGINELKSDGSNRTNFAYLNSYSPSEEVVEHLRNTMVNLPSDINILLDKLETKKDDPILSQVLNKLNSPNTSEQVKNEILYKLIQNKLDMNMIIYSKEANGSYSLKVRNANSADSEVKLKTQWLNNLKNSALYKTNNEERVYNKTVGDSIIKDIDNLQIELSVDKVQNILGRIGIQISNETIEHLIKNTDILSTRNSFLGVFRNTLQTFKADTPFTETNPLDNARGVTKNLIETELEITGGRLLPSFRVAGKSLQGAIQKMMSYDITQDLKKENSVLLEDKLSKPYTKDNFFLQQLRDNKKVRDNFNLSFVSLVALKENGTRDVGDKKLTKLPATDKAITELGFFQNLEKELGNINNSLPDVNYRIGKVFTPTLSDKDQMVTPSIPVMDLSLKNFQINDITQEVEVNDNIVQHLTEQLFYSELERVYSSYSQEENIIHYNDVAKRFLGFAGINDLEYKNVNIHDFILENNIENTKKAFTPLVNNFFKELIKSEAQEKVKVKDKRFLQGEWIDKNVIATNLNKKKEIVSYTLKFLDSQYIVRKGEKASKDSIILSQIASYDYVINKLLSINNIHASLAGDIALYAPKIKKAKNRDGSINNVKLTELTGQGIAKRMASLIAPGNKLANSEGDKYIQIFLNDVISPTSTAENLIRQYYGKIDSKNKEFLERLRNSPTDEEAISELAKYNEEIGGYFEIEGTDAQEYTTWKEHIDILQRQGRLKDSEKQALTSAYNKLTKGEEISAQELKVVMNPIKPVYTGVHIEPNSNVSRNVYIKSSSFPLLPQLTKGLKLDAVRQSMEQLQEAKNMNVRASYQTANKVGALKTPANMEDLYYNENTLDYLEDKHLVLDRNYFRIQQDTPYKTAKFLKANKEDAVSQGSQMWKLLMGSGINKIEDNIFPNLFSKDLLKEANISNKSLLSGKDLDKLKFFVEKKYSDLQKNLLYKELGLDSETRKPKDEQETLKRLYTLLQKEVTTRNYPDTVVDTLKIIEDAKGQSEFALPLWLSNGADKFESLMQAIITNRLIKYKLPGNMHISSSSEGFEKVVSIEEVENVSNIVWTDPTFSGELKATYTEDGKLKESEVLLQSKFRISEGGKAKLIDLTSQEYSYRDEQGNLILRKGKIDPELLSNFSFRIPTSAHQSGAILKVVGFLPEASGDLLVVPKEHTVQIGEDYDVDKRTLYKSNYKVFSDGRIAKVKYQTDLAENTADEFLKLFGQDFIDDTIDFKKGQAQIKMLENAMIDLYKSVYQTSNNNVQKKINKILSFDFAGDTANLIFNKLNEGQDSTYFNIFSDKYQTLQMNLGADGKAGIGVHSNAVVLQAMLERLENKNRVTLYDKIQNDEGKYDFIPSKFTLGNLESYTYLGAVDTLDGDRTIADVGSENQNSATDNVKAQIMGKRNENAYTMSVLAYMTHIGFDKADLNLPGQEAIKVHLPSLFLSQPILRRYVELKEAAKSISADFSDRNKIEEKLETEFNPYGTFKETSSRIYKKMTANVLYDNLGDSWDSDIQMSVFEMFKKLEEKASLLNKYQKLINMSTSGLGVSYFDVLDRIEILDSIGHGEKEFSGIENLIGEISDIPKEGFTKLGQFYWKPTTTEGTVLINSLSSADDLMSLYFPYNKSFIKTTLNKFTGLTDIGPDSYNFNKIRYGLVSSFKDFLYSGEVGLFDGDANRERERLFFDDPKTGKKSLASYLLEIKQNEEYKALFKNLLLKDLSFERISKNGSPSIITHNIDSQQNFEKSNKYNSFINLLEDNSTVLPTFNKEEMTPRKLAQDLASYSYLANNEKGAIGFRDYIHNDLLEWAGVSSRIRSLNKDENTLFNLSGLFLPQFLQHNPNLVPQYFDSEEKGTKETLPLIEDMRNPSYVRLRNTTKKLVDPTKQYSLYRKNGNQYERITTLGTFGFNEYNPLKEEIVSSIYPEEKFGDNTFITPLINNIDTSIIPDNKLGYKKGDSVSSLLETISKDETSFNALAKELLPLIDDKATIVLDSKKIAGSYNPDTRLIKLSPTLLNNKKEISHEVILEEVIHDLTVNLLYQHGEFKNGEYIPNSDAPTSVTRLNVLFKTAQKHLPYDLKSNKNYYSKDIFEFIAGVFVSDQYQKDLDNLNLLERFYKAFIKILKTLAGGKTFTEEAQNNVRELLGLDKKVEKVLPKVNPIKQMKNKAISLGGLNFTSSSNENILDSARENDYLSKRLPEIKKCR